MLGIIFVTISAFLSEIASSTGKWAIKHHWEHPAVMGLLNNVWTTGYFLLIALVTPNSIVIVPASIPFLILLLVDYLIQTGATLTAIGRASRSTFSLLRTLTIPILACIDALTRTDVAPEKFFAMACMFLIAVWLYRNHGIEKSGAWLSVFTAVNAAFGIALTKYIFDMGTSVVAVHLIYGCITSVMLLVWSKQDRASISRKHWKFIAYQSAAFGLGSVFGGYALTFAPASIVTAASRSLDVLFSIIFGHAIFKERHIKEKVIGAIGITVSLIILAI